MDSWTDALSPQRRAGPYDYDTPCEFFDPDSPLVDGVHHHWPGLAVKGMPPPEGEQPQGLVKLTQSEAVDIKAAMKRQGIDQKALGKLVGRVQGSTGRILRRLGWVDPDDVQTWKRHLGIGG